MASFGMALYTGREMSDTEKRRKTQMEVEEAQSKVFLDQAKEYFSDMEKDMRRLEKEARYATAKKGAKEARATLAEYEAAAKGKEIFDKYLTGIENGDPAAITAAVSELAGGNWTVDPADDDGFEGGLHLINTETGMRKMYVDPIEAAYDIGSLAMGPEGRKARAGAVIGGRIEASKEDRKFQQKLMELREQMRADLIIANNEWRKDPSKAWDAMFTQSANEAGYSVDKDGNMFKPDPNDPSLKAYASPDEVRKVADRTEKYLGAAYDLGGKASPQAAAFSYRKKEAVDAAKVAADKAAADTAAALEAEKAKPRGASTSWGAPARPFFKEGAIGESERLGMFTRPAQTGGATGRWTPSERTATTPGTPTSLGTVSTAQFFNSLPATDKQELRYDEKTNTIRDRVTGDILNREDLLPAQ